MEDLTNDEMIHRLKTYRNGIHGEFFLQVAERLEALPQWISVEDFDKEGFCWIAYKGNVVSAYRDKEGFYRFDKHSKNAYLRECIKAVYPIPLPSLPKT